MRRLGGRNAALMGLVALAVACSKPGTGACGSSENQGTFNQFYNVIVPRPEHGTVSSSDGRIRCGTGGDLCGDPVTGTRFEWSTAEVTLTPVADADYHFDGWAGDCRGSDATCTVTRGADRTVVAVFLPNATYPGVYFTVTVARPVGGTVYASSPYAFVCEPNGSSAPCGPFPIKWHDAVTLTAFASDGFVFHGWSGPCSGKAPCTLTRDGAIADKSVSARFIDAHSLPPLAWDEGNWDEGVWE